LTFPARARAASSAKEVTEGNRLYKQGHYGDAASRYDAALAAGGQEAVARYNLGDALYKQGKGLEDKNIKGAIEDMQRSIADYEQVLKKNAKDADAQYNYEFVKKELERLKKKKEQQQKQQQQQQNQQREQKPRQNQDQQKQQQQKQQQPQQQDQKQPSGQQKKDSGGQDKEMPPQEAKDILEGYQRNEEPQGLLNFIPKEKPEKPVEKDW